MNTAKQLLQLFCEKTTKLFLVVDGLDECSETERRVLADYLNELVEKSEASTPGKLRLLIVSQMEGDIKKLLFNAATLTISSEHNGDDIRAFVDQKMISIAEAFELDKAETEHVASATCARASGACIPVYKGSLTVIDLSGIRGALSSTKTSKAASN